jgi:hypothetical protein
MTDPLQLHVLRWVRCLWILSHQQDLQENFWARAELTVQLNSEGNGPPPIALQRLWTGLRREAPAPMLSWFQSEWDIIDGSCPYILRQSRAGPIDLPARPATHWFAFWEDMHEIHPPPRWTSEGRTWRLLAILPTRDPPRVAGALYAEMDDVQANLLLYRSMRSWGRHEFLNGMTRSLTTGFIASVVARYYCHTPSCTSRTETDICPATAQTILPVQAEGLLRALGINTTLFATPWSGRRMRGITCWFSCEEDRPLGSSGSAMSPHCTTWNGFRALIFPKFDMELAVCAGVLKRAFQACVMMDTSSFLLIGPMHLWESAKRATLLPPNVNDRIGYCPGTGTGCFAMEPHRPLLGYALLPCGSQSPCDRHLVDPAYTPDSCAGYAMETYCGCPRYMAGMLPL